MAEEPYSSYSFLLDRTARRVKQYAQRQFNELGFNITVDQWLVMKHLSEQGEMTQTDLGALLLKDNPTVTRIIDLLSKKGLAERRRHPSDRRCFMVALTAAGRRKVDQLKPRVRSIRLKAWEGLSPRDFAHFRRILDTIYENLR